MRSFLAGIRALILAVPLALAAELEGAARVIDGDTIEVAGQRVRLHGIDAPERKQTCKRAGQDWCCGKAATVALRALVGGRHVRCASQDVDRYGRTVARCSAAGTDIGEWMVGRGWALAYRQYSTDYVTAEGEAKATGAGIWGSAFMAPWEWRKMMRDAE